MSLQGVIGGVWVCPACSKIQRTVSKASDLYDAMMNVMHSCPPVPVHELLLPERHSFLPDEQRWRSKLRGFPRSPGPGKPKHTVFLRGRFLNKLKTTPTPNKIGSYGIKGGGSVCHKSRSSYAIKVGSCTTFSVQIPLFQGISTPYGPSFYGIFWGHIFC